MMTKLRSGQGKRDDGAAAADDDYTADDDYAADQSNTYMSPSQATQKVNLKLTEFFLSKTTDWLIYQIHSLFSVTI